MLLVCVGVAIYAAIEKQWLVALGALIIAGFPVAFPRLKLFELGGGAGGNLPVLKGEMVSEPETPTTGAKPADAQATTPEPPEGPRTAPPALPAGQESLPRSTGPGEG